MRLAARKSGSIRPQIIKTFAEYTNITLNMKPSILNRYESQKELINKEIDRFISIFKKKNESSFATTFTSRGIILDCNNQNETFIFSCKDKSSMNILNPIKRKFEPKMHV
jgi:hypothetical protein